AASMLKRAIIDTPPEFQKDLYNGLAAIPDVDKALSILAQTIGKIPKADLAALAAELEKYPFADVKAVDERDLEEILAKRRADDRA
ncbi:hypothetical protein HK104_004704, partial [Borealophlyctis nickersoniae]